MDSPEDEVSTIEAQMKDLNVESEERTKIDEEVAKGPEIPLSIQLEERIQRCQKLHDEFETYGAAVDAKQATKSHLQREQDKVEYRKLRNDFRNELRSLQKLVDSDIPEDKMKRLLGSSNLVYYEALWAAAKRSKGLISFRKYFFYNRNLQKKTQHALNGKPLKSRGDNGGPSALVDIVACDGMEWIRVNTISERSLLYRLAELGWHNDSSDEDDTDEMNDGSTKLENSEEEDEVALVRNAMDLARAARANPIRAKPPQVRLVLPRIASGRVKEVDSVLDKIRATGTIVECSNGIKSTHALQSVLPDLLPDCTRNLSYILNIDATILLALISDISHRSLTPEDWMPYEVKLQITDEAQQHLLPSQLYPVMANHPLVCTTEAADQMKRTLGIYATDTEKQRAEILLGESDHNTHEELLQAWQCLSDHTVPPTLDLPIRVVSSAVDPSKLPAVAADIAKELTPMNKSIFFYGWANGLTTVSSNWVRTKQINAIIAEKGMRDGEAGPHTWLCANSRSLVTRAKGKEKTERLKEHFIEGYGVERGDGRGEADVELKGRPESEESL